MFDFSPDVVVLLIPILAVVGGIGLAVVGVIMKGREEELKHKERIIAMEKGMPVPEMPKEEKKPAFARHRTWGLVLTFLGLALIILRVASNNFEAMTAGIVIAAIGLGLLCAAWFERRDMEKR